MLVAGFLSLALLVEQLNLNLLVADFGGRPLLIEHPARGLLIADLLSLPLLIETLLLDLCSLSPYRRVF